MGTPFRNSLTQDQKGILKGETRKRSAIWWGSVACTSIIVVATAVVRFGWLTVDETCVTQHRCNTPA